MRGLVGHGRAPGGEGVYSLGQAWEDRKQLARYIPSPPGSAFTRRSWMAHHTAFFGVVFSKEGTDRWMQKEVPTWIEWLVSVARDLQIRVQARAESRGPCGRLRLMGAGSRGELRGVGPEEPGGARRFATPIVASAKPTAGIRHASGSGCLGRGFCRTDRRDRVSLARSSVPHHFLQHLPNPEARCRTISFSIQDCRDRRSPRCFDGLAGVSCYLRTGGILS